MSVPVFTVNVSLLSDDPRRIQSALGECTRTGYGFSDALKQAGTSRTIRGCQQERLIALLEFTDTGKIIAETK